MNLCGFRFLSIANIESSSGEKSTSGFVVLCLPLQGMPPLPVSNGLRRGKERSVPQPLKMSLCCFPEMCHLIICPTITLRCF